MLEPIVKRRLSLLEGSLGVNKTKDFSNSNTCHIILPYHDLLQEERNGVCGSPLAESGRQWFPLAETGRKRLPAGAKSAAVATKLVRCCMLGRIVCS